MALITTDGTAAFFCTPMSIPPIPPAASIQQKQRRAITCLAVVNILIIIALVSTYIWPDIISILIRDISPGCLFRKYTGLSCPGCGGTRAARAMLAGDWLGALKYNFLLPLAALILTAEYIQLWLKSLKKSVSEWFTKWYRQSILLSAWAVLVWFVLRNILGI